jgi:glycosyltransferase involved in cell wall biosynthesis
MVSKKIFFICHESSTTGAPLYLMHLVKYLTSEAPNIEAHIFFCQAGDLDIEIYCSKAQTYHSKKRFANSSFAYKCWLRLRHYAKFIVTLLKVQPDLVYSNTIVNFGEVSLAKRLGFKVCVHVHEGLEFLTKHAQKVKKTACHTHDFVAGSIYVEQSIKQITDRESTVLYNGTDCPPMAFLSNRQRGGLSTLVLGIIGTIDPNKGQLTAIESAKILKDQGLIFELRIAGSSQNDDYYTKLVREIQNLGLEDSVKLMGKVSDALAFISNLDILIVPSFDEAFPTVILESFSVGTPVIASNVGGIPEMIDNETTGLLFERGNSKNLVEVILKLKSQPILLKQLSENGLHVFTSKFDRLTTNKEVATHLTDLIRD